MTLHRSVESGFLALRLFLRRMIPVFPCEVCFALWAAHKFPSSCGESPLLLLACGGSSLEGCWIFALCAFGTHLYSGGGFVIHSIDKVLQLDCFFIV